MCADMTFEDDVARFKEHYLLAVKYHQTEFVFDGQRVLTAYAKYYIEYLDGVLKKRKEYFDGKGNR